LAASIATCPGKRFLTWAMLTAFFLRGLHEGFSNVSDMIEPQINNTFQAAVAFILDKEFKLKMSVEDKVLKASIMASPEA
jgi:hypothetical protein